VSRLRLLAGPDLNLGPERLLNQVRRLGPLPAPAANFVEILDHSGLTGRGGASFPVGKKWRAVANAGGGPVVLVNGAEGEPQSMKDRVLMGRRPHLILDGALVAAHVVRASRIAVYVGEEHRAARVAMATALAERPEPLLRQATLLAAPNRYVAGESSAAVNFLRASIALPTSRPPAPHEAAAGRAPTLVQNVETLAQVALIARHGAEWFRSAGRRGALGTVLITLAGAVTTPGVVEVEAGTTVSEALEAVGGARGNVRAFLLGGYFGAWVDAQAAWDLPLDGPALRARGLTLGSGVVGVLPTAACGVCETARVMRYLAAESSAQCGPCFFGLRALADACERISTQGTNPGDLARLHRWAEQVRGRGGCHHPDGAILFLESALRTFASEFAHHSAHPRSEAALPIRRVA
jgi:NADH:ubiquinone oxidoreductase subunit F (NADH-binding)